MASKIQSEGSRLLLRDDIATPATGARLAEILVDARGSYSRPDRIRRHIGLSADEKRVILSAWLLEWLRDPQRDAGLSIVVQSALAELAELDAGAAGVLRRAFESFGFAAPS